MLIKEFYLQREDGVKLYRSYSDENFMIKQLPTEILYSEAIDVENAPYTYEETNIPVEGEGATIEDYQEAINYIKDGDV